MGSQRELRWLSSTQLTLSWLPQKGLEMSNAKIGLTQRRNSESILAKMRRHNLFACWRIARYPSEWSRKPGKRISAPGRQHRGAAPSAKHQRGNPASRAIAQTERGDHFRLESES